MLVSVEAKKNIPANILDALAKKGRSDQASISTPLFWTLWWEISQRCCDVWGHPPGYFKVGQLDQYKECSTHTQEHTNVYSYIYIVYNLQYTTIWPSWVSSRPSLDSKRSRSRQRRQSKTMELESFVLWQIVWINRTDETLFVKVSVMFRRQESILVHLLHFIVPSATRFVLVISVMLFMFTTGLMCEYCW